MVKMPAEGLPQLQWVAGGCSVRGSLHVRDGRPNQDAIAFTRSPADGRPVFPIVAVADGHGSSRHFRSETGSRLAVQQALSVLTALAPQLMAAPAETRTTLARSLGPSRIVDAWVAAVRADLVATPIDDDEWKTLAAAEGDEAVAEVTADPLLAYGATLLAALAIPQGVLLLQLGDGDILAVADDGTVHRPLPADERLVGNLTTSLCQMHATEDFRVVLLPRPPALLLLSTDGYANSYRTDNDFLQVGRDYLEMIRTQGWPTIASRLPEFLEHTSNDGSGDDITLGVLLAARSGDPSMAMATAIDSEETIRLRQEHLASERRHMRLKNVAKVAALALLLTVGWIKRETVQAFFIGGLAPQHVGSDPGTAPGTRPVSVPIDPHLAEPRKDTASKLGLGGFSARLGAKALLFTATWNPATAIGKSCEAEAILWNAKGDAQKTTIEKLGEVSTAQLSISMPWASDDKLDKAIHDSASRASMRLHCDGGSADETGNEKIGR